MLGNIYDHELSGEDDWLYRKISNESLPSMDLRKMSTDEWKSHAAEIRKMLHEEKTTKKPIIGSGLNPAAPNPMNGIEMNEVAETFLAWIMGWLSGMNKMCDLSNQPGHWMNGELKSGMNETAREQWFHRGRWSARAVRNETSKLLMGHFAVQHTTKSLDKYVRSGLCTSMNCSFICWKSQNQVSFWNVALYCSVWAQSITLRRFWRPGRIISSSNRSSCSSPLSSCFQMYKSRLCW